MFRISRILILAMATAFVTTGTSIAQNAPPPQQQAPTSAKKSSAQKGAKAKCSKTLKGCHKNQSKGTTKPPTGSMPNGMMPPHTPNP